MACVCNSIFYLPLFELVQPTETRVENGNGTDTHTRGLGVWQAFPTAMKDRDLAKSDVGTIGLPYGKNEINCRFIACIKIKSRWVGFGNVRKFRAFISYRGCIWGIAGDLASGGLCCISKLKCTSFQLPCLKGVTAFCFCLAVFTDHIGPPPPPQLSQATGLAQNEKAWRSRVQRCRLLRSQSQGD